MRRLARDGPLIARVEFDEPRNRPGSTKTYWLHEGAPVRVKLVDIDESEMTYRYRLIDDGSLPATDYVGCVRVTACGPDACHLKVETTFTAVGVTEDEFLKIWLEMETVEVEDVRRRVETRRPGGR
jgi:hypothetical protein